MRLGRFLGCVNASVSPFVESHDGVNVVQWWCVAVAMQSCRCAVRYNRCRVPVQYMRPTVHDEDAEKVTEIANEHLDIDAESVPFSQRLKVVLRNYEQYRQFYENNRERFQ